MGAAEDQRELIDKVNALARKRWGAGDHWRDLFDAYDSDSDGEATPAEINELLRDAGVGNSFTRGMWVAGVIGRMDRDDSGAVSFVEMTRALTEGDPRAPKATGKKTATTKKPAAPVVVAPAAPPASSSLLVAVVAGLIVVLVARQL
jgi:Ca2+-binding EF-hand superfamily protein